MNTSAWLWTIQNSWHSVSAVPKPITSRAPRKSKLGQTSSRAAKVRPIARAANIAIGASTSAHTPWPAQASPSATPAPSSEHPRVISA